MANPRGIVYREAGLEDVPAIVRVTIDTLTAVENGRAAYDAQALRDRWERYLRGLHHPRQALAPRIAFAAFSGDAMAGYIAGHFSERHGTDGELQSVYVLSEHQRQGIGTALLLDLARWFAGYGRRKVCVGIEPTNPFRRFYEKQGARYINKHWLVWDDITALVRGGSSGTGRALLS